MPGGRVSSRGSSSRVLSPGAGLFFKCPTMRHFLIIAAPLFAQNVIAQAESPLVPPPDPSGLGEWLIYAACVLAAAASIRKLLERKPRLDEQFAAREHHHAEYVATKDLDDHIRLSQAAERANAQSLAEMRAEVQAGLTAVNENLRTTYTSIRADIKALGIRLDPIAEQTVANEQIIKNHLEDHRRPA
jgi:hypothetical protein